MASLRCTPLTFLLAGFTWLLLASLLGIATLIGLVQGTPLPAWLKSIHVHGAMIGGLLQLVIGGLFASIAQSSDKKQAFSQSRPALFLVLNGMTIGLLVALSSQQMAVAGIIGAVLIGAILRTTTMAWRHIHDELNRPKGTGWIYRGALVALLLGLVAGTAMAFRLFPEFYSQWRLMHIHLIVLGFFTLVCLVGTHQLLPVILKKELLHIRSADVALWGIPLGFATLLGGFATSSLRLELAVGLFLLVCVTVCTFRLIRSWVRSGTSGNVASDHLLIGAFFLLLATATGLGIGANYLPSQPFLPIGSLHLVAYTHLAFVGFMVQSALGALSYALPAILASSRVPNLKKRGPYRDQLDSIMNRLRMVQMGAMSLGTMGLAVLAAIVWSVPLASWYVQWTVWITAGLLLMSLTFFSAKLAWAVGLRPPS